MAKLLPFYLQAIHTDQVQAVELTVADGASDVVSLRLTPLKAEILARDLLVAADAARHGGCDATHHHR